MHQRLQPEGVFEPAAGLYSQVIAVADGPRFEIAGTLPYRSDGGLDDDLLLQAQVMMDNLGKSLDVAGLQRSDVVRIRVFTTRMDAFLRDAMQTVFGWFGDERPTSTLVEVNRLANPHIQLEIDAEAVQAGRSGDR